MYFIILLSGNSILTEELLETSILTHGILHLYTCGFDAGFGNGHACLGGNDAACRSLRTVFGTDKVGLGLGQSQAKFGILDDDERITFLYLLEIRETYLANKALHTTALRHDVLAYTGIVGKFSTAEVHKLAHHINGSTQEAKHDERIV